MVIIGRVTPPNIGLAFSTDNVQLKIGQKIVGTGSVYISRNALIWQPVNLEQDGISIFWKQISVHGIPSTPSNCIYFMLDHQLKWPGVYEGEINNQSNDTTEHYKNGSENESEEDGNDIFEDAEGVQMTECWLIPHDINSVNTMYVAMSDCQASYSDSSDSISEDSEEDVGGDVFPLLDEDISVEHVKDTINNMSLSDQFADADE